MEAAPLADPELLRIESFGVRVDIRILRPELRPMLLAVLPPGWREAPQEEAFAEARFNLLGSSHGRFIVLDGARSLSAVPLDLDVALAFLEWRVRGIVARWAPEHVFVRAGVVIRGGRALVLPGGSFSGKTTLVAALVRAGAGYYSDEFAVFDDDGLVHPYRKPLVLPSGEVQVDSGPGNDAANGGLPVAVTALTEYVPGAQWQPSPLSAGEAALALLSHTVPAQERPAEVMRVLRRVLEGSVCVRGDRGEAEAAVPSLLSLLGTAHR